MTGPVSYTFSKGLTKFSTQAHSNHWVPPACTDTERHSVITYSQWQLTDLSPGCSQALSVYKQCVYNDPQWWLTHRGPGITRVVFLITSVLITWCACVSQVCLDWVMTITVSISVCVHFLEAQLCLYHMWHLKVKARTAGGLSWSEQMPIAV